VDGSLASTGHFAVLRWRNDGTRDEARNVAVIVVSSDGRQTALRAAPISSISPRLHDQGILDAWLVGLERQFQLADQGALELLTNLHDSLHHSLYLTEPKPTAVPDLDVTAGALYRAFVAPRSHGSSEITSGRLLDQTVKRLRQSGLSVRRGEYVDSFLFDAVIDGPHGSSVIEVLSFATSARNWTGAEHDAGHFLYAVRRLSVPAAAVIKPPAAFSSANARRAYQHVAGWMKDEKVQVVDLDHAAEAFVR
jgi:hypothetical protein